MSEHPEGIKPENKPEDKGSSLKSKFPKKPNLPKNPFNFYWIYGLIAVAIVATQLFYSSSVLKEIKSSEFFESMLKQHHVARVVVIPNQQIAEIYLNRADLKLPQYVKEGLDQHPNGPHFKMKIL